jgi:hypothetical protein
MSSDENLTSNPKSYYPGFYEYDNIHNYWKNTIYCFTLDGTNVITWTPEANIGKSFTHVFHSLFLKSYFSTVRNLGHIGLKGIKSTIIII